MKSNLNNSDAYRFLSIRALPILSAIVEANGFKYVKPASQPKSTISDIIFKFRDSSKKLIETSPTIYYPEFDSIAISLHKMMYCKHILFVKDNKVYIISQESLLSIWNNKDICKIDRQHYQDGLGERAQMSRIDINWAMENASYVLKMNEEHANKYHSALKDIL
jgi:hypothetical protein